MILTEKVSEIRNTSLTPDGDSFRMKVPVLQADVENANRRRYPFAIVKAAVEELRGRLKKRTAFGSTKHEKDLEVDQVSHVVEDISLDEKGLAHAIVRIFGTTKGKNLSAIIQGGGAVGVSARGMGDVDASGNVKEGYKLLGVDFTLMPSFAFHVNKAMVFESLQTEEDDGAVTEEQLKEWGLVEDPLTEEALRAKYGFALQAGYKGSLEQYRAIHSTK